MRYLKRFSTRVTPQWEPIPGSDQVMDNAGGFTWQVDDWKRLDRFLILGSEGGTYYVGEHELTVRNATAVLRCIAADGARVVDRVVEISEGGNAPKNDPALFVLAMCAGEGDDETRKAALTVLPRVARIGTHLFHFLEYVQGFRGWGRGLREAVADWYNDREPAALAYQVVKYRQREGWAHRDALRLAHPKAPTNDHNTIYHYITQGWEDVGPEPHPKEGLVLLWAFERARRATTAAEVCQLIRDYGLTREMVPTDFLPDPEVWDALLDKMPVTAMIRNLGNMSRVGLLVKSNRGAIRRVTDRLGDADLLKRARVHPLSVLGALNTYGQGRGFRGSGSWEPVSEVVDALDGVFYSTFQNVEPTGKHLVLGLDVSGSMTMGNVAGVGGITPRVGTAAMALVTAAAEPYTTFLAFSGEIVPFDISPRQRLDAVVKKMDGTPFGRTDCAQPMLWAIRNGVEDVDAFVIYTDNETWCGKIHPAQALGEYRRRYNPQAKLVVVAMVSTGFSIADPNDAGMMDVVGFDTATPRVVSGFVSGEV
jgi:60 kDa SS-A/Ro ribonucleoprotein